MGMSFPYAPYCELRAIPSYAKYSGPPWSSSNISCCVEASTNYNYKARMNGDDFGGTNPDRTQLVDIGRNLWSFTSVHLFRANSIALSDHVWSALCTHPRISALQSIASGLSRRLWSSVHFHFRLSAVCFVNSWRPSKLSPCSGKVPLRTQNRLYACVSRILPKSASGFLFAIFAEASVLRNGQCVKFWGIQYYVGLLNSRNSIAFAIDSFIDTMIRPVVAFDRICAQSTIHWWDSSYETT